MKNRNLLFVGTEFGVFASLDRRKSWFSLKNNLPTAAVHDIAIHSRQKDLIIGTHGRGIWIMDDISFLQEMSPEVLNSEVRFFKIRPETALFQSSRRESCSKPVYMALKKEANIVEPAQAALKNFDAHFVKLEGEIVPKEMSQALSIRETVLRGGPLNQQILRLGTSISGFPAAPSQTDLDQLREIQKIVDDVISGLNKVIREDLPGLNNVLEENKLKPLEVPEEVKL